MIESMFHLHVGILEKLFRPAIMYLVLVVFLRLFGKRELAQLNPFDLVVLLCLSNTVQNAIIGEDNSVTGGIIGAFSLLGMNWMLTRVLYRAPRLNAVVEGPSRTLIADGRVDEEALKREALTEKELLSVLHKQSFSSFEDAAKCVLEPNGTFYIEAVKPSLDAESERKTLEAVESLREEIRQMRAELSRR